MIIRTVFKTHFVRSKKRRAIVRGWHRRTDIGDQAAVLTTNDCCLITEKVLANLDAVVSEALNHLAALPTKLVL